MVFCHINIDQIKTTPMTIVLHNLISWSYYIIYILIKMHVHMNCTSTCKIMINHKNINNRRNESRPS